MFRNVVHSFSVSRLINFSLQHSAEDGFVMCFSPREHQTVWSGDLNVYFTDKQTSCLLLN